MKHLILFVFIFITAFAFSQTNIKSTNPVAENVMLGNYDPALYTPSQPFSKTQIVHGIWNNMSTDSLKNDLQILASFYNRNTGSDTVSNTRGVGAARRWIYSKFQDFSSQNQNRLIPSYLQFDQSICNIPQHRNIFAVLPGTDTTDKSVIIIEGHMDSRCENGCDTSCLAQGMEDNGSGTSLIIELARVMTSYSYKQSIVFLITIGEEQGLDGANAFAAYCQAKGIKVKAVLNNDIVGGIICGKTASPPGCPGENDIDSMSVRIFSFNTNFSAHKSLARFIKLEYDEEVRPWIPVPTTIYVMNADDRTGRGGDHIPFRMHGYSSVRFTSTNEHGDANSTAPGYTDRQHSFRDILGKDINNDGLIDSYYVDFNYLKRNAMINANALVMAAIGPKMCADTFINDGNGLKIMITPVQGINAYRIGIRSWNNDFDSVYTITNTTEFRTYNVKKDTFYFVSTASVNADGTESLFTIEKRIKVAAQPQTGVKEIIQSELEVLPPAPNPFDETTTLAVMVNKVIPYKDAWFEITDMSGKKIVQLPVSLNFGMNETLFEHGFNAKGIFIYTFYVDGKSIKSGRMVFR